MTLTLATTPDLLPESRRLAELLRAHGTDVAPAEEGAADEAALLGRVRSGGADLALLRAVTLLDLPDDLRVVAVPNREEPRDVVIPGGSEAHTLLTLPPGARVGVTHGRRRGFLRAWRPDLEAVHPGNGEGPEGALRSGSVDALIMGNADARRLALRRRATEILDPKSWVPGPGQGMLLLVARAGEDDLPARMTAANDASAHVAWRAESAVLAAQGVTVDAPIGVMALPHGKWIRVWGMVASVDGTRVVRGDVTGNADDPEAAGRALAELLVARGVSLLLRGATS